MSDQTEMLRLLPETCVKFALAVVLAGILGIERERKGRAAGLRTHVLVCLGATLLMVVADILARQWNEDGAPVWLDKGRIAAGIVTGVGFLGAGTIINIGGEQRGLTTAAMLWFAAALGIAIGAGYYLIAVSATCFALAVVLSFERLSRMLPSAESFSVSVRMPRGLEKVNEIEDVIRAEGFRVTASRIKIVGEDEQVDMTFNIRSRSHREIERLAQLLRRQFDSAERIVFER